MQVCNTLGQCHCDYGYAPPDCSKPGGGGSRHSNQISPYPPRECISTDFITQHSYLPHVTLLWLTVKQ